MSTHELRAEHRQPVAWAVLLTLYMLGFTNLFLRNSLGIMAPSMAKDMALTPETLSIVASSFFFAYGLMQIPSGMLLDRFGARRTLAFLLLFTTAGAALFSMSENVSQLVTARILMGIGCAGIFSGAFFVINQLFAADRVITQTGLLNSFAAIGGLCATAPLAALLTLYDWRSLFWAFTIGVAVLLVSVMFGLKEPPRDAARVGRESFGAIFAGVRRALAQPGMKRLLVVGIPLSSQTTIMGAWGAPYLRDVHHLDDIQRGSVMLAMAISSVFGHSCIGFFARLLNSVRNAILASSVVVVVLLALLAALDHPPVWAVAAIFATLGFVTMYPM
ncbi:MAG: MFS transporter, partial [Alphaproteobacteria bacterium]|nr:MFS transporter [Alphaproteobacteria bacterium]